MGMTDKHKAKTELRYVDLDRIVRVNVWGLLRTKKEKGSEARRMKRALAALKVDDKLIDDLSELQALERITNRLSPDLSQADAKKVLAAHREAKKKLSAWESVSKRLCVSMENLGVYAKHIAGDEELNGAQIDELGNFFDEIENAAAADPKGAFALYLYEDGVVPAQPAKSNAEEEAKPEPPEAPAAS